MSSTDRAAIDKVIADATDASGSLIFHWSGILIGCRKTTSHGTEEERDTQ